MGLWGRYIYLYKLIFIFASNSLPQSHVRVGKKFEMENELRLATSEQRFAEERVLNFTFLLRRMRCEVGVGCFLPICRLRLAPL